MDAEESSFHDYTSMEGRLTLLLYRMKWKYVIPPAILLATFAAIAVLIAAFQEPSTPTVTASGLQKLSPGNSLLGEDDPALENFPDGSEGQVAGWTVLKQPKPGFVEAEGCENGLYPFDGFDSSVDAPSAVSLRIRDLVIDAPSLSRSLQQWTKLESIVIENVWVNGNFSRVYLPNLKKFIYHQFRNGKTDQYKQDDTLKQILFFDKSPTGTWDLNRDLLNLNVTIQVSIEGTKILDIEPEDGEININTHTCEDYLKHFDEKKTFSLSSVSLNWCPVGNASIQKFQENSKSLEFLFLNNAVPSSTQQLAEITNSLKSLKELHLFQRFHCDWPGYEIYLNVSGLSPTLETLSVTNLDLSFDPNHGGNSIKNLSLDQYVGEDVVSNFPSIFPNLRTLALFNVTQNRSYLLMEKVLFQKGVKPELVIVTDFARSKALSPEGKNLHENSNSANQNKSKATARATAVANAVSQVEQLLQSSGIPSTATCFQLELKVNGTYTGRELTSFERNFLRFSRLAFRKIDTYADYVTWDANPS